MKVRDRRAASVLLLAMLLAPPLYAAPVADEESESSEAGPSPQDRALAEALFREGKQLGESGQIAKACKKFKESQRLDPAIGTLLHLAACYAEDGKTASAWAAFNSAAELARRAKQKDRAELAATRAEELEKQLSRLVIVVTEPAEDQSISLDGQELGEETLSTPLPLDPGKHVVTVTAPGKQPWKQELEIAAGPSSATVEVPALEDAPSDVPPPVAEAPAPAKPAPPVEPETGGQRTLAFVAVGVGALGIAAGSYFGLRAASQADDADQHCRGTICTQAGMNGHDQARTSALIANVLFGVGIAGLGVGAYLFFSSGDDDPPAAGRSLPRAGVWVGAGPGQLAAGGSF